MFKLGKSSINELEGVHASLVSVVHRAIELTVVDFGVHDGIRTLEQQKKLLLKKAARTLKSKHLVQTDGFGHAVDLVPYINGKLRWEWGPIYRIAAAVHQAAQEQNVDLVWGGVWDRRFGDLDGTASDLEDEVEAYAQRRKAAGKTAFLDGPHYQLA